MISAVRQAKLHPSLRFTDQLIMPPPESVVRDGSPASMHIGLYG
jgi:hypothetical protein